MPITCSVAGGESREGGFGRRVPTRVLDPTLLAVPVASAAFVVLRSHHLIAQLPLWAIAVLMGAGYVVSAIATAWCPVGAGKRRLYVRVGAEMLVIGTIVYAIGWGPTLALGLLFGVIDCTRTHGSVAARPATVAGFAIMAAGQGAIALHWAPTLVRPPFVNALAVLAALGFVMTAELVRLAFVDSEHGRSTLAANERRFKALVQHAADLIVVFGDDGFRYVSPAFYEVLGYDVEETPELDGRALVHPEDLERVVQAVAPSESSPESVEVRLRTAAGEWRWFDARITDLLDDPDVDGVLANLRDIDDRKQAEAALSEAEERFRTAFEAAPIGMGLVDRDGRWIRANLALGTLLGHTPLELLGAAVARATHPDDRAVTAGMHEGLVTGSADSYQFEKRYVRPDGSEVLVLAQGTAVRAEDGALRYVVEEMEDITERRRSEEALRASEENFRVLFASNPQPMWVYAESSLRFLEVNQAAIAHYGYSRAEFLAMSIADIRPAQDRDALWQATKGPRPSLQSGGRGATCARTAPPSRSRSPRTSCRSTARTPSW